MRIPLRIAATLALLFSIATGATSAEQRPNLLLIVSEDNGPELGCYGDQFARTPHLDRLAAEGVCFHNAFVPYSVCSPSRACFLTGLYPHENGQIGLATHKFAMYGDDIPNVVTLLKPAGYRTGIVGKLHVNPESAFPFDYRAISVSNFDRDIKAEDYAAAARAFWTEAGEQSWFLSVNFPDAHLPFIRQVDGLPNPVQSGQNIEMLPWVGASSARLRTVMADYYNCMARLDAWVGLLLDTLAASGQAENTLVIYIGDHGAQFPRGKGTVYEGGLRVPMIIRWPRRIPPGLVRTELVSTLDILPTILGAAKIDAKTPLSGLPLQPLFGHRQPDQWREYIYAMTTGSFPRNCFVQHSIRDHRYKLISNPLPGTTNLIASSYLDASHPHYVEPGIRADERATVTPEVEAAYRLWEHPPRYELYDLQNDPREWQNLAEDPALANVKQRLITSLQDFQQRTRDPFLDSAILASFVAEQLANRDPVYREQPDFRWSYQVEFPRWRAAAR
jgi:N-sulfoglucosamine sulfohydrolase